MMTREEGEETRKRGGREEEKRRKTRGREEEERRKRGGREGEEKKDLDKNPNCSFFGCSFLLLGCGATSELASYLLRPVECDSGAGRCGGRGL